MGLFDKLARKKAEAPLTAQEAVGALLYFTVRADGEISEEEKDGLVAMSNRIDILRGQTSEAFRLMLDKAAYLLDTDGFEVALTKLAAVLPQPLREMAFVWAAELAFADGEVKEEESGFLEGVQEAFQIEDDLALKIAEVMQIKHRN